MRASRFLRLLGSLVGFGAALLAAAPPASAHEVSPGHYRSEVVAVDPPTEGVAVRVVGGDSLVEISVDPGREVVVSGYEGEPYLRIDEVGRVWVNVLSPATYLNEDRYGNVRLPRAVDVDAAPRWKRVGAGGSWAWHDHRIHWMASEAPAVAGGGGPRKVFDWRIDLRVDARPVVVEGRLYWMPPVNPLGALAVGTAGLAPLVLWRRGPHLALGFTTGLAAAVGWMLAVSRWAGTPAQARGFPVEMLLLAAAAALAAALVAWGGRDRQARGFLALGGGIALLAWVMPELSSLRLPVLVGGIPDGAQRAGLGLVLWGSLGVVSTAGVSVAKAAVSKIRRTAASGSPTL